METLYAKGPKKQTTDCSLETYWNVVEWQFLEVETFLEDLSLRYVQNILKIFKSVKVKKRKQR